MGDFCNKPELYVLAWLGIIHIVLKMANAVIVGICRN